MWQDAWGWPSFSSRAIDVEKYLSPNAICFKINYKVQGRGFSIHCAKDFHARDTCEEENGWLLLNQNIIFVRISGEKDGRVFPNTLQASL